MPRLKIKLSIGLKSSKPPTASNPKKKKKQRKNPTINATTWFSVSDEANKPIETKDPPKNNNPINEPQVPPESILFGGFPSDCMLK